MSNIIRNKKKIFSSAGGFSGGIFKEFKSVDIASASTTDLSTATGNFAHITGTTTITSFGTLQAGTEMCLVFDGSLTLTYNATSMILPYGANIITQSGDIAIFRSEGSGNWRCITYQQTVTTGTWSPSWTGFSANPSGGVAEYTLVGDICTVWLYPNLGTSNATTCTVTLPFAAKNQTAAIVSVVNNGTNAAGVITTSAGSNVITAYATAASGAWTASGNKRVVLSGFSYRIN